MWSWGAAYAGDVPRITRPTVLDRGELLSVVGGSSEGESSEVETELAVGVAHHLQLGASFGAGLQREGPMAAGDPALSMMGVLFRKGSTEMALGFGAPIPLQGAPGAEIEGELALTITERTFLTLSPSAGAEYEEEGALFHAAFPAALLLQASERLFFEGAISPPVLQDPMHTLAAVGTTLGGGGPLCDLLIGGGGSISEGHFHPEATLSLELFMPRSHAAHAGIVESEEEGEDDDATASADEEGE